MELTMTIVINSTDDDASFGVLTNAPEGPMLTITDGTNEFKLVAHHYKGCSTYNNNLIIAESVEDNFTLVPQDEYPEILEGSDFKLYKYTGPIKELQTFYAGYDRAYGFAIILSEPNTILGNPMIQSVKLGDYALSFHCQWDGAMPLKFSAIPEEELNQLNNSQHE